MNGKVAHKSQLEWLTKAADRLPGVVAVIEEVTLNPPSLTDLAPMQKEVTEFLGRAQRFLPVALFCLVVLLASFFISRILNHRVKGLWKTQIENPFLLSLVSRVTLLPVWIFIFYLMFKALGFSTLGATLIGGTGVLSVVLGLALRGTVENYLAGLFLASRSPFTKGDLIRIGTFQGYVQNLNMRGTTIIDMNGNLILIPNLMVIQSPVENHSANPNTRTSFEVGIGYRDSIEKAQDLIVQALKDVKGILESPAPSATVDSLTKGRVTLKVQLWFNIKDSNELRVKSRAIIRVKETLLSNGISMPDETRELVFMKEPVDDRQKMQDQAAENLNHSRTEFLAKDAPAEELLKQADQNPLPVNREKTDLLKKS